MQLNFFLAAAIAAIVPLIVGSIWYNPKVFGSAWMNVNGFNEEKLKEGFNMPLVFVLSSEHLNMEYYTALLRQLVSQCQSLVSMHCLNAEVLNT